jgi:hypothetical protein
MVEVRTRLNAGPDGLLSGTYDFADNGLTTSGTLSESTKTSETIRSLTWIDVYGIGPVVMVFDAAGQSFAGKWNSVPFAPAFRWDGERCDDEIV